jgi:AcrR family transcriptional regulator
MKVTKEAIVLSACELFREKGYAGASMQDLATAVGLQKASLYARFPNKEALVTEVLKLTLRETFRRDTSQECRWEVAYEADLRSLASNLADKKRCVALHLAYGVGDENKHAKAAIKIFFQMLLDRLTDVLVRAMPRSAAEHLASDALARLEGATLLVSVFNSTAALESTVRALMKEAQEAAAAQLVHTDLGDCGGASS